jgi:hypothetical protein
MHAFILSDFTLFYFVVCFLSGFYLMYKSSSNWVLKDLGGLYRPSQVQYRPCELMWRHMRLGLL